MLCLCVPCLHSIPVHGCTSRNRKAITAVIGDIEFNFFHRWSDFIFVVSALLTIVVFFVLRKVKGSGREHTVDKFS